MAPIPTPLKDTKFNLNSAGVAGFFGADEAISAMATVHLYEGRRWLGWFNSPGSYLIAKRFGRMANSRFWDGLFPGSNDSPALTFELDGKPGPKYIAALSGTTMQAGHLAYLTMERSKGMSAHEIDPEGRCTKPVDIAYLAMSHVDYEAPVKRRPIGAALLGLIPISVSAAACIMCALVYDWLSFSMILLGIVSSGLASYVIGNGRLVIRSVHKPADGAPPGHGVLIGEEEVVVIKGKERDVNAITKGRFDLETGPVQDGKKKSADWKKEGTETGIKLKQGDKKETLGSYHDIGVCSLLLLVQFLLQLLLVPQGTLFGQIMFLFSLGISWGYNSYLSSLEKEKIQTELLFRRLGNPQMRKFRAGTRTTMTVFVCLLLFHGVRRTYSKEDKTLRVKVLHECLPNDTVVWQLWTQKVVQQLLHIDDEKSELLPHLTQHMGDLPQDLSEQEEKLLNQLLSDASSAFKGYFRIRNDLPIDSSLPEN